VNTTASAKAVKVRFLEGKNSKEVLDFNLFLSHNDVWTASVVRTADGAKVTTTDQSCTLPAIPADGKDFVNYAYSDDGADSSLDRTREGYVEIIEMATFASTSTTAKNITHVGGVPPGCAVQTDAQAIADQQTGNGGLFGAMTLINVLQGSAYSQDATALDNFNRTTPIYSTFGDIFPNLNFANPPVSVVVANGNAVVTDWSGTQPVDAVSATLMHNTVMNEYVTEPSILANTDWVVTMPTKNFYVSVGTGPADRPFQRNFDGTNGSCDDVSLQTWDREERTPSTPQGFSPPPPAGKTTGLCWEANVINFLSPGVLGSTNSKQAALAAGQVNGWAQLRFIYTGALLGGGSTTTVSLLTGATTTTSASATYAGLPVVGFAVQAYNNNLIVVEGKNVQSTYGADFAHRFTTLVTYPLLP
jgi:hypothetical protein